MYKKKIKKAIKDFFQYEKKDDNKILDKILDEFNPDLSKTEDDKFIAKVGNSEPILRSKNDVVGLFLANIPYYFTGKGELYWDLPVKVLEAQKTAVKLLEFPCLNTVTTLEEYLIIEMGLRELYTAWLGDKAIIRYKEHKTILKNPSYRRVKLYIRRKGWSIYTTKVNGEIFPYSQASLINWASKFIKDDKVDLAIRLSINIRNLLAHGEVEWNLYPTKESIEASSKIVKSLFENLYHK